MVESFDNAPEDSSFCDLSAALKGLSSHPYVREWSPDKSIYKLLYIFCLPELDGLLNAIQLLSSSTSDLNLRRICIRCVEEGQVAQLAALLLFAWKSMAGPDLETNYSPIAGLIMKGLLRADINECLFNAGGQGNPHTIKKTYLTCALEAVIVLNIVRDVIHEYRDSGRAKHIPKFDVPYDIAYKIWYKYDTEGIYKPEDVYSDDIPCLHPKLNAEEKASFKEALERQIQIGKSSKIDLPVSVFDPRLPHFDDNRNARLSVDDIRKICLHDDFEYEYALQTAIEEDNRDVFIEIIKSSKGQEYRNDNVPLRVFKEDAVDCFAAILNGEADGLLTLKGILSPDAPAGWTLLHEAAKTNVANIASLLLESGFEADANTTSFYSELNLEEALPLHIILANARLVCMSSDRWTGRKSAVGLIIRLCGRTMSGFLETVRVLALKTYNVKQIFLKYLREGKMLEVGALLMVARKQLMSFSDYVGFKSIRELRDHLVSSSYSDYGHVSIGCLWKDEHMEKKETWALLEIFDKTGDAITAYIQQEDRLKVEPYQRALKIATILEDAGFKVTHKDAYVLSEFRTLSDEFGLTFLHKEDEKNLIRPSWDISAEMTNNDKQVGATNLHPRRHMSFTPICQTPSMKLPLGIRHFGTMSSTEPHRSKSLATNGLMSGITVVAKPLSGPLFVAILKCLPLTKMFRIIPTGRWVHYAATLKA